MAAPRFESDLTAILVVDLQEKLLPVIHESDAIIIQAGKLLDAANVLGLNVLATEQYPQGLGPTVQPIATRLQESQCSIQEKLKFSACIGSIRAQLTATGARSVVVCGIESHVCILQSCLDLLKLGLIVGLAVDAIGSRRVTDHDAAVSRMVQAGVVPTTVESLVLELVHEAGTERFKSVLPIVR